MKEVDFNKLDAYKEINDWVNDRTNGLIKKAIKEEIDPDLQMYLLNTTYFKGLWKKEFKEKDTKKRDFVIDANTTKKHPMMSQKEIFQYVESDEYQIIKLFYKEQSIIMEILLPKKGESLEDIISNLNAKKWAEITGGYRHQEIGLWLPKFKISYDTGLNDVLTQLGMREASDENNANFNGIYDNELKANLFIDKVIHKAVIEVNEKGTEAAAVTAVKTSSKSVPRKPETFHADHPFFYMISDEKTDTILFMGIIKDPLYED